MLKPVLAEVEQDTNEETPLVSEATFAEEIADATAPGRGRQGRSPRCIDRFDCDGWHRASRWQSASWNDCFGVKGPKEREVHAPPDRARIASPDRAYSDSLSSVRHRIP